MSYDGRNDENKAAYSQLQNLNKSICFRGKNGLKNDPLAK
jgi:hypothetical protein